jgi:hypothetical protein
LFADKTGEIVYASLEIISGKSVQTTVAGAIEKNELVLGFKKDNTRHLVLSLAVPITNRRKLYGVGVYNLFMEPLVGSVSKLDGSSIFLVDYQRRIIAGTNKELFEQLDTVFPQF